MSIMKKHGGKGELWNDNKANNPRMVVAGIRAGWLKPWELDPEIAAFLPRVMRESLERAADSGNDRDIRGAATCLIAMQKANLELAKSVDEHERLEGGEATSRQEITLRIVPDD